MGYRDPDPQCEHEAEARRRIEDAELAALGVRLRVGHSRRFAQRSALSLVVVAASVGAFAHLSGVVPTLLALATFATFDVLACNWLAVACPGSRAARTVVGAGIGLATGLVQAWTLMQMIEGGSELSNLGSGLAALCGAALLVLGAPLLFAASFAERIGAVRRGGV